MTVKPMKLAPYLTVSELQALQDESLPFDAIALYMRAFRCIDAKKSGYPITISHKTLSVTNGYYEQRRFKALRPARTKTLIKHLERVGLIEKSISVNKQNLTCEYNAPFVDDIQPFTLFESEVLMDCRLSYESLCLYIRAIRPNLDGDTLISVFESSMATTALTFVPVSGSTESYILGRKLLEGSLNELENTGLIAVKKYQNFYYIECFVGKAFNVKWFKNRGICP
ncbi:hypothetical protein [Aliiglaciecola aliphaticivorans]